MLKGVSAAVIGVSLVILTGYAQSTTVVLVDGSVNPQLIPAVAAPAVLTAQQSKRQQAQLAPLGLSSADSQKLKNQLSTMLTLLDSIQVAMEIASPTDSAALAALKAQRDTLMSTTIATIKSALSADGVSRLGVYISNTVKRNIIIYGAPN